MPEFIYQMHDARKAHGSKVILDEVTLSFYPGAKIGVVGPNGMGKSTLLKIMAGLEDVSNGEARLTPGFTVGILQQEPELEEDKTVIENVRLAFGDMLAKIERFNQVSAEMADPDADFDALMEEMGKLQDEIDAGDGWDLDSQLTQAMDALQLPRPGGMPVNVLSGGERRRVALCRLLLEAPDLLLLDEPTNHLDAESVLWLEQFLKRYQGAVLAVTHDRYFLDNVAEWICEVDRGHLYPVQGQLLHLSGDQGRAPGSPGAAARPSSPSAWSASSSGCGQLAEGASGEEQGPSGALRADGRPRRAQCKKLDFTDIHIPAGPRLGQQGARVPITCTRSSATACSSTTFPSSCRATASWASSAPTAWARPRSSSASSASSSRPRATLDIGETVKIAYVDQNRAGIDPDKNVVGGRVRMASTIMHGGRDRGAQPRLRGRLRFQGPGPAASPPACSPVASATA